MQINSNDHRSLNAYYSTEKEIVDECATANITIPNSLVLTKSKIFEKNSGIKKSMFETE